MLSPGPHCICSSAGLRLELNPDFINDRGDQWWEAVIFDGTMRPLGAHGTLRMIYVNVGGRLPLSRKLWIEKNRREMWSWK